MEAKNTGGPAFPTPYHPLDGKNTSLPAGMSLRDYFAAKAMQAAATNPKGADGFTFEERAAWAYQQADAMLAARES
jgi:hypothetical protein